MALAKGALDAHMSGVDRRTDDLAAPCTFTRPPSTYSRNQCEFDSRPFAQSKQAAVHIYS
jgi:hypothetical protein